MLCVNCLSCSLDISYACGSEDDPQARLKHVGLTLYNTQQFVAGPRGH